MHSEKLQYVVFSEVQNGKSCKRDSIDNLQRILLKGGRNIDIEANRVILCLFI